VVQADLSDIVAGDCESVTNPAPDPVIDVPGEPVPVAIDDRAPETTILKAPRRRSSSPRARIAFESDEPGSSFECRLDGGRFRACESPRRLRGLDDGVHRFRVRAIDGAGNVDPTPAKILWRIET
jgi:hypothetical protein